MELLKEFLEIKKSNKHQKVLVQDRILEFAVIHNLVVSNSLFTKRESHLVTYQSG